MASKRAAGGRSGHKFRARWPHLALFTVEPQLAAVWRLVILVAALWAVLFVLR